MQRCLMLGAGHTPPIRRVWATSSANSADTDWVRLDINPECGPDVAFDLDTMEHGNPLPFPDETFDEIHAYEVLEHYGTLGDYRGFFVGMCELWRVLKPGGIFFGCSPSHSSVWAFGDPGHRRVISHEMFSYLCPRMYAKLGQSSTSDYRRFVDPCWWEVDCETTADKVQWALLKVKEVG